jgi:hypothetical protein
LEITRTPFTQSRTPSSLTVRNVYVSEYCPWTWPVQRAEKVSGAIDECGDPVPQSKSTVASVRVTRRAVKSLLS